MAMTFNRTQLENAELRMLMTVLGRVTPANWMQLANIESLTAVTPVGIATLVKLVH